MRQWIIVTMLLAPVAVLAQPSGSAGSGSGSATGKKTNSEVGRNPYKDAGSAGSADVKPADAAPAPAPAPTDLRKICADAMNADETFAKSIVEIADKKMNKQRDDITLKAHEDAAEHIAKNERHVILAYAAMWVVAALFVLFLWRRQQGLKIEIARLQKDLAAAAKEPEKPEK